MEEVFAAGIPRARRGLKGRPLNSLLATPDFGHRWATDLHAVLAATLPLAEQLFDLCARKAAGGIYAELVVCERAGPRRARGSALAAQRHVETVLDPMVTTAADGYAERLETIVSPNVARVHEQVGYVILGKESAEGLDLRLFSREPLTMLGNSGRGVWWRASSAVQAVARGVSIDLVNGVRLVAMGAMNDAAG